MTMLNLPHNLVAGQPENVNHLMNDLNAIKDHINGNLDATNLATSAKPATLLAPWETLTEIVNQIPSTGSAAGTFSLAAKTNASFDDYSISGGNQSFPALVPITAADLTVTGLTTKLRLQVALVVNGVAPARTFTFGLYPVTFTGSGSGAMTTTLGTVVAGSTVAFASPALSSETISVSTEISLPANGIYALGMVLSGALTANSTVVARTAVQVRHIV